MAGLDDIKKCVGFAARELGLKTVPKIDFVNSIEDKKRAFGHFFSNADKKNIRVRITNRHPLDVMRTVAHELYHYKQKLAGSKDTEQKKEDEANAVAGRIMRKFDSQFPKMFKDRPISEAVEFIPHDDPRRAQNQHLWHASAHPLTKNEDGSPRVYYTGTSKDVDFAKFNVGRHGAWLTADPKEASEYAIQNDSQGYKRDGWKMIPTNTASRVIPVHVNIKNPYTGDLPQTHYSDNYKKSHSDWFDKLRAAGHDGWMPSSNPNLAVPLLHATQIKSAVGNNGHYDPRRPNITEDGEGAAQPVAANADGDKIAGFSPLMKLGIEKRKPLRDMIRKETLAKIRKKKGE